MPRRAANSGSVVVRADKRVIVYLPKDLDPKRKARYGPGGRQAFTSAEQATLWLDAEIRRRRAPPATASADEPLGAYLARWFDLHEGDWPERTRIAYAVSLRRWATIGSVRLGALTRETIQGVIAELQRATWQRTRRDGTPTTAPRPYSRRTIAHARTVLHQALDELIPDVLTHNPARQRRRARPTADPPQPVWTAEQASHFLTVAERTVPQIALGFRLVLRRALRTGECVDLKRSDVVESRMVLTVDETAGRRRGTSGPPKGRRHRDVPLSTDLLARIKAHQQAYPATDPHLFTLDGRALSLETFRAQWHRTVRVAGLPPITPKDGRATCATLLLDAGWPLPEVSRLLGHSNIATTAKFYARQVQRNRDTIAKVGEHLDATFDAPPKTGETRSADGS